MTRHNHGPGRFVSSLVTRTSQVTPKAPLSTVFKCRVPIRKILICSVIAVRCWHRARARLSPAQPWVPADHPRHAHCRRRHRAALRQACHKQIMALHSTVFADMLEMTSDVEQRAHGSTPEACASSLDALRLIADCEFAAVSGETTALALQVDSFACALQGEATRRRAPAHARHVQVTTCPTYCTEPGTDCNH